MPRLVERPRGFLFCQRQREAELRATVWRLARLNRAAMRLHQRAHDGQPQPAAAGLRAPRSVQPVEAVEDVFAFLRCDAFAGISDGDTHERSIRLGADADAPALRCVAERIVEEVEQNLDQAVTIGV